mmetsp:Transcript_783/g.2134  ORF Transcript_783/g.2134 Transcript_783/m.2134 type:complete len:241 (-) Transcript_783:10-732(-)
MPMTAACRPPSPAQTWLAFFATVLPSRGTAKSRAASGIQALTARQSRGAAQLLATPRPVGIRTILTAESRMPSPSTGTTAPIQNLATAGVASMAQKVVLVVITTESATSPLARSVRRLEPVPPFTQPIITSPTRWPWGRPRSCPSAAAIMGRRQKQPPRFRSTGRGLLRQARRSSAFAVIPMMNARPPSMSATCCALTQANTPGKKRAVMTEATMHAETHGSCQPMALCSLGWRYREPAF